MTSSMKEIRARAAKIKPEQGTSLLELITITISNVAAEVSMVPGNARAAYIVKRAELLA